MYAGCKERQFYTTVYTYQNKRCHSRESHNLIFTFIRVKWLWYFPVFRIIITTNNTYFPQTI